MFYLYNKFKSSSTKGHDERSDNRDGETNICTTSDDNTKEKKYIDGFRKEEDDDLFLLLEESTHNREKKFKETQSCEAGNKGMCDSEEVDVKGVNPEYVTSDLNKQDESWMQFDVKWDEVDSYPIKMLNTNVSQDGVHYKQFDDSGDDFFKIDQENFSTFTFSTCDDTKRKSKIECSENVGLEGERNPRTGEENSEGKKNGDYIDITCTVDTKNGLFENRNGEIKNFQSEGRNCEITTSLWQTEEPTQLESATKNDKRKEKHKNESTLFFRKEEGISKKDEHERTLFEEEISFFSLNERVERMEVGDETNRNEKSKECLLSSGLEKKKEGPFSSWPEESNECLFSSGSENKKECLLSSWPEESKECPFSSGPQKNISHERIYRIINPPAGKNNCGDTHAERRDDSFNFDFEDTGSEENIEEDCQEVQKSNCQRGDVHNEECVNRKHVPWYVLKKSSSSANGDKEGEVKETEDSSRSELERDRSDLERDRSDLEKGKSDLEKGKSELEKGKSELERDISDLEEAACEHKQIESSEPEVGHESGKQVLEKIVLENKYTGEEWKSISKKHEEQNCEDNLFLKEDMEDDKQKRVFYPFHLEDEGVCRVGVENTEEGFSFENKEAFDMLEAVGKSYQDTFFENKEAFDMLEAVGKSYQDTFCENKEKFDVEEVAEKTEEDVILEKKEAYDMGKDGNKNEEKDFIFYMERGHKMENVEQMNEKGDFFFENKETFDIGSIEEDREDYVECDSFEKLQINVDGDNVKLENASGKDHVGSVDICEHVLGEKREETREVEEEGAEKEGEEKVNTNLEKKKNEGNCEDVLVHAKETNETEVDNSFGNAQVEHEKETSKWKKENVVLTLSHDGSKQGLLSLVDLNSRYLHIGDNKANGGSRTLKGELNDVICSLSHEQYLRLGNDNWAKEKFDFYPNMPLMEENEIRFNDDSGNELWDEEEIGKDECGKEEIGKDECGKEEIGKDECGKEEIGKEEIGKEEIDKEEIGKEEIGKEESCKEEIGKGESCKEEIDKEEIDKEEIGKEEIDKEEIGKGESCKEEIGKEEIDKEEIGKGESCKEEIGKGESCKEEIDKEEIGKEESSKEESSKEESSKEESSKEACHNYTNEDDINDIHNLRGIRKMAFTEDITMSKNFRDMCNGVNEEEEIVPMNAHDREANISFGDRKQKTAASSRRKEVKEKERAEEKTIGGAEKRARRVPPSITKPLEYEASDLEYLKALKELPPLEFLQCKDLKPFLRLFNIVLKTVHSSHLNGDFAYVLAGDETGCIYVKLDVDITFMLSNCVVSVEGSHIILEMNEYSNIYLLKYNAISHVRKNINYSDAKFVTLSSRRI
ncbi:conserved Plasmodium protein, unknown function [Plasmodium ovale]|uniref:Uncharacterized protein n=1 Tax=Plasmodium ovale TaxID=36330 RepID=A0A1C3KNW6_PLAOA|nr:conserved Plasmodium protein, unknown function [Plasmodium ovale]